ncbi:MAG: sortase [Actinomycetota bacterium]|nr:sortase [Actinomycetota bacterium]
MRRAIRWTGRTFILLGMTMLFFVVYETWGTSEITHHHQSVLAEEFDPQLARAPEAPETPTVRSTKPTVRPRVRERTPIARIIIPKIGLSVIVVQGTTLGDLAYGPGHYVETPMPWELGPTGIAGHRTGWSQPFYHLDLVGVGDMIYLKTTHGKFSYRVTKTFVVEPKDTWVLNGNPNSKAQQQLVLTTCTPAHTSLHRLIVWADLVPSPGA